MRVYDLKFSDGKGCRYIAAQPEDTEQEELAGLHGIFGDRLISMVRIIAPAPTKLPWKRDGDCWRIGLFVLTKQASEFKCTWPGGEILGGKDVISSAVRKHWHEGVLT